MNGVCLSLFQYKVNMGCLTSTSQHKRLGNTVKRNKPSLIKTPLTELHHYTQPHYIIFPSSYESFRHEFEEKIGESFPQFTIIRNRQELAGYDQDGGINILLVTCERPQDAQQIISLPNFHTFSFIGFALSFHQHVLGDSFKRKIGFRFGGFIKFTTEGILNFMKEAKEPRSVLFCHQDYGHINRTNLTMDFFVRRNHEYDRTDFFNWARHKAEGRDFIEMLQGKREEQESAKLIIENMLSLNALCMKAVELLGQTRNPCVLAHAAWFYSIVFDRVRASYPQSLKKIREEGKFAIAAWVALSRQDIAAMALKQNFMFSSFVVGSTKSAAPKPSYLADKTAYLFTINLPPDLVAPLSQKVDTGFLFEQDTVIFNLQNMYRLVSFDHKDKLAEATYCASGLQYVNKVNDDRYKSRNTDENVRMMATYDAYWLNALHVNSQLDLMFSLQFYHQYKRSVLGELQLIATKNSIGLSTNGPTSLASTAVSLIRQNLPLPSKALLQKIGDCEASIMNIQGAEECYNQMESIERQLIKKAYLYYPGTRRQERVKFRETIEELQAYEQSNKRPSLRGLLGILEGTFKAVMEERGGLPRKDPTNKKGDNLSQAIKLNNISLSKLSNFFILNYGKNGLNLHNQAYQLFYPQYVIKKVGWEFSKIRNEVGVDLTQNALETTLWKLDGLHAYLLPEDSSK